MFVISLINPFHATGLFLYPMKISEILWLNEQWHKIHLGKVQALHPNLKKLENLKKINEKTFYTLLISITMPQKKLAQVSETFIILFFF